MTLDLRPVTDPEARSLLEDLGLVEHTGAAGPLVSRPRRRYRIRCCLREAAGNRA